jgi:hypothetical protein
MSISSLKILDLALQSLRSPSWFRERPEADTVQLSFVHSYGGLGVYSDDAFLYSRPDLRFMLEL